MTLSELKELLRDKGEKVSGKKSELIDWLVFLDGDEDDDLYGVSFEVDKDKDTIATTTKSHIRATSRGT